MNSIAFFVDIFESPGLILRVDLLLDSQRYDDLQDHSQP